MDTVTIKGIILPAEWNQEGNTIRIVIVTYDEDRYLVVDGKFVQPLTDLLRKKVIIRGWVTMENNLKTIDVVDFSVDDTKIPDNP